MRTTTTEGTPAQGAVRGFRSLLFAGCAVWLSLVAHVAGGGVAPSVGLVVGLVLLTSVVTTLLAGRRRGHLSIAALLLAFQILLHQAFASLATGTTCQVAPMAGHQTMGSAAHAAMAMSQIPGCTDPDPLAGAGMAAMTPNMVGFHLLAAVSLAALLSHGERVLWWVLTWFIPTLPSTITPSFVPVVAGPVTLHSSIRPQPRLLSSGIGRRGPPAGFGAPA